MMHLVDFLDFRVLISTVNDTKGIYVNVFYRRRIQIKELAQQNPT